MKAHFGPGRIFSSLREAFNRANAANTREGIYRRWGTEKALR
jgi:hypothetical protein